MHIPTFKMPTIRQATFQLWGQLAMDLLAFSYTIFSKVNRVFLLISRMLFLHIPIVKDHHCFFGIFLQHKPYHWKVLPFGLAMVPRVFTSFTKPYCSFPSAWVFMLLYIWLISWSQLIQSILIKR